MIKYMLYFGLDRISASDVVNIKDLKVSEHTDGLEFLDSLVTSGHFMKFVQELAPQTRPFYHRSTKGSKDVVDGPVATDPVFFHSSRGDVKQLFCVGPLA